MLLYLSKRILLLFPPRLFLCCCAPPYTPKHFAHQTLLEDCIQTPPNAHNPRRDKAHQTHEIACAREQYQAPVLAAVKTDQRPGNRYPSQATEADDGIACGIIPPVLLRLAQLAHTHRRQADIASTREPEAENEDDDEGDGVPHSAVRRCRGEPETDDEEQAQEDCDDHCVEASPAVCHVAGEPTPEERSDVENGQQLIREGRVDTDL